MAEDTRQGPTVEAPRHRSRWRQLPFARWLDAHYNDLVVVAIAFVTVVAGLTAFLQSWASNHYAQQVRRSQTLATETLGHDMRSRQREWYDFILYTTWNEWDWRRSRAKTRDPALAERAQQVVDMIAPLSPLMDEEGPYYDPKAREADIDLYHADINIFTTTLLAEQRAFVAANADAWNGKADGYVTVLTILAVTLFLYGLSTTIKGNLRFLFAIVGTLLLVVALVQVLQFTLSPVPEVPYEAIEAYARGYTLWNKGQADEARAAIDEALDRYGGYGRAYRTRGEILLDAGEYEGAVEAYRQAIANGSDDVGTYWDLGWALYLAGDYGGSIEASRRALELDPRLLPVRMNVATALLAQGQEAAAMQEYEAGLNMAVDPALAIPSSWSRLYLRETVNDLDRLINALDGQTDFYQVPDLDKVGDKDAVRRAAVAARERIKEGMVALESRGTPEAKETAARLGELSFALYAGRRGDLLGASDTFPRGILSLVVSCPYQGLTPGAILSRRVVRMQYSGVPEYLPPMGADIVWDGASQGTLLQTMDSPWPGQRGLLPGIYTVEYYVDGNLLQSGTFTIPDKKEAIVGPIVMALESQSGGIAYGPDSIFPAGAAKIKGIFSYSGLPDDTLVYAYWYRNGSLYDRNSSYRSNWGSEAFSLYDVPAGDWTLELYTGQELLQSVDFQVVPVDEYLQEVGMAQDDALFQRMLGDVYANAGDYERANAYYERATQLDPQCADCYYRWWSALYDNGDYEAAVEPIQRASELSPEDYTYLANLGKTYYHLADEQNAKAAFRRAVAIAPAYAFNSWGNALYELKRYDEAVVKYQQAIEMAPDNATYYSNLGGAYKEMEEYELAMAAYAEAVALNPDYDAVYNRWGNILYNLERYEEAAEKYRQAIAIAPNDAVYRSNLGGAYRKLGEWQLAAEAYAAAVEIDPTYAHAWNQWGNALYAQGQYADAAAKYQEAVNLRPNTPVYHYNLGLAYYQLGRYADARPELQRAADLAAQQGDRNLQRDAEDMLDRLP